MPSPIALQGYGAGLRVVLLFCALLRVCEVPNGKQRALSEYAWLAPALERPMPADPIFAPRWVPSRVRDEADFRFHILGYVPKDVAIIRRIVCDTRMKTLWTELKKHRRVQHQSTTEYLHPAIMPAEQLWEENYELLNSCAADLQDLGKRPEAAQLRLSIPKLATSLDEVQELACGYLFIKLLHFVDDGPDILSSSEYAARYGSYAQIAKKLRGAAEELDSLGSMTREASQLRRIAVQCDENSKPAWETIVVPRKRGSASQRRFVIELGETMRVLFGKHMTGVIATAANVVLEQTCFSADQVTTMLPSRYHRLASD